MTALDLDGLAGLLAKATPGPWRKFSSPYGNDTIAIMKGDRPKDGRRWPEIIAWAGFDSSDMPKTRRHIDARLIVAAVNALPSLIERVRELEGALRPFAEIARVDVSDAESDADLHNPRGISKHSLAPHITIGDLRRARAALKGTSNDQG